MWRFIVVTFGFLGFAFYQLSGGAGYVPAENSFQARAADKVEKPVDVQVALLEPQDSGEPEEEVTRAATLTDLAITSETAEDADRFEITLASIEPSDEYEQTTLAARADVDAANAVIEAAVEGAVAEPDADPAIKSVIGTEVFSLETYSASQASSSAVLTNGGRDVRQVTGDVVNMRAGPGTEFDKIGKLSKGAHVAVLDAPGNGWIKVDVVETGASGWMADWLVTASN